MNQILSVERPQNNRNKRKSSIHSIITVFAVILMIFGIGLTSTGAYSYYKSVSHNTNNNIVTEASTKPIISIERESASTVNIVVTHDKEITNITYTLNNEEPVQISGNKQTQIKQKVELPVGSSSIVITAQDINGITSSYNSSFEVEQKPTIKLEQVEGKIQATTESNINIDYVMYYWDEDQENAIKSTINDVKNVTLIDVIEGTHILTIVATDIEGNETTKTQKVIGDNKPEVNITTNGKAFQITAKDDEELVKMEYTLNTNQTETMEITGTEYFTTVNLENGENKLTVVVYNKNGLSETMRVKYTKE